MSSDFMQDFPLKSMGNYAENLKGSVPSPTYDLGLKFLVSQFTHLLNGYNGICLAQKEIL